MKTEGNNTFQAVYRPHGADPLRPGDHLRAACRLMGNPRPVPHRGRALNAAPEGLAVTGWSTGWGGLSGALSPLGRDSQRLLLELEGVPFRPDGTVDLEACMWYGPEDRE